METGFDVLGSITIGILMGAIANKLSKKYKIGLLSNFAVGMIGALTGSFILNLFRFNYDSFISLVLIGYATSIIVAAIFLFIAFKVNKKQYQN